MQWIKQSMMQVTGSNKINISNIILSIRFTPSGLYYSITKQGRVETLDYIQFNSNDTERELAEVLLDLKQEFDVVNVIIDTDDLLLVPDELITIEDKEAALNILSLNAMAVNDGYTPIITQAKRGIKAIMIAETNVINQFKVSFPNVKFYATIISDILIDGNAIVVTMNDRATSISCSIDTEILCADVISSSTDIDTTMYYIQSIRDMLKKESSNLPIYISGARVSSALELVQAVLPNVEVLPSLGDDELNRRADIGCYNDLIRLSNENN